MRTELSEKRQRVLTIVVLLVLLSFVLRLFYFQVIAAPELNKESSADKLAEERGLSSQKD